MRLKASDRQRDSVLIIKVLAKPGTPSSMQWPRLKSAINNSSRTSWRRSCEGECSVPEVVVNLSLMRVSMLQEKGWGHNRGASGLGSEIPLAEQTKSKKTLLIKPRLFPNRREWFRSTLVDGQNRIVQLH